MAAKFLVSTQLKYQALQKLSKDAVLKKKNIAKMFQMKLSAQGLFFFKEIPRVIFGMFRTIVETFCESQ